VLICDQRKDGLNLLPLLGYSAGDGVMPAASSAGHRPPPPFPRAHAAPALIPKPKLR
jgi:hypothetical protein